MNNNILLISCSFEDISLITYSKTEKTSFKTTDESHYPIGLAYIHSYLESKNYKVTTLFLNHYNYESCFKQIIESVEKKTPYIIGFQILTPNRVSTYNIIEYFHSNYPEIHLIIGGIHSTIMYHQLLTKYPFLIVVLGEGELTFEELANKLSLTHTSLDSIKGIAYFNNNMVKVTPSRHLIKDLDILPFPKHSIFFTNNRISGCIITSRGCPFHCTFCCLESISNRRVRYRSIDNIIMEIESLVNNYPQLKEIWIHDDSFFLDNNRVISFCNEIIKKKINVEFVCSGRVKPISKNMIFKLEQANFKKVMLGLESGDKNILKNTKKGISLDDTINAVKLFHSSSIMLHIFLIIGLPGETEQTIKNTIKFIKKLQKIKYIYYGEDLAILTVYPGTEIYELTKQSCDIADDFWLSNKPVPLYTSENSIKKLFQFKEKMLIHLSINRLTTWKGFLAQFNMIPYIYLYTRKNYSDFNLLRALIILFTPSFIYNYLKKKIYKSRNRTNS
jgi:anaerobic magnesium-protoporphyrin IX monomethyl ester cyclase